MYSRHLPSAMKVLHKNIYPIYAKGSWLYSANPKTQKIDKYLDLTSGIGALSTGHSHSHIISKVQEQVTKYVHTPQMLFNIHEASNNLTSKLLTKSPNKSLDNVFYVNSGSEATDNAIKIARAYNKKQNIITMTRGFHGRTYGALSLTSSNLTCKKHINPLISGVYFCEANNIKSFIDILTYQTSVDEVSAVIYEPVQGEGGIFSLNEDFLTEVHQICEENNILTIADEVQCGFGRTGTYWNVEQKNVNPDILTFGKGIASGFPMAGLITKTQITDNIGTNFLGGTYGGNAICCAAALATIDIFDKELLLDNVTNMGNILKENLKNIPNIKEVRIYGLMVGIELTNNVDSQNIIRKLNDNNILILSCGNNGQYIRLLPSLNVNQTEIDLFLEIFERIMLEH